MKIILSYLRDFMDGDKNKTRKIKKTIYKVGLLNLQRFKYF